jgi:tetraacyldisaccharide 4'-kinase
LSVLTTAYSGVARARRSWYTRRPHLRRNLGHPVVSVGNLVVGGSGKTPVVAAISRLLVGAGHRPAVLSRGYGRRRPGRGVVVVSDGARVLEPVERSGDEPQMLARMLPGVPVLVAGDRYMAGRLAESRLGATVLILDDGFQHVQLARDVDLLLVSPGDLGERVIPSGRLREPLDAAGAADALLVPGSPDDAVRVAAALGVDIAFALEARFGPVRPLDAGTLVPWNRDELDRSRSAAPGSQGATTGSIGRGPASLTPEFTRAARVVAVAGIARPERFFDALARQGLEVARAMPFRDHHWFSAGDLARIDALAGELGAALVVTTEKDAVRIGARAGWAALPMDVAIEPAAAFRSWLEGRL